MIARAPLLKNRCAVKRKLSSGGKSHIDRYIGANSEAQAGGGFHASGLAGANTRSSLHFAHWRSHLNSRTKRVVALLEHKYRLEKSLFK